MNRKNLLFKINFLVFIFSLFMLIIVISCGGGGGGGGGILPPIGGGSGDSTGTPNISFNNQGYLIIETKSDSLNTNSLSFNFQTVSPNILANQNSEPLRNINNNIREYKCGFKPSNKNQFNQNIYYSTNPPSVDAMKSFTVIDDNTNTTVTVNAKCVYVNNNLKYAIWVDINNADNYDEEALFNANQSNIISHFNNDYNTLTTNIDSLNFYVDILITEKIDSNSDPSVIGYFWGAQDLQRVNVHPFTFSLNYGTYNEFNVTLAHEFVHLLEYN
ncbi:MAG: hypothetical protein ACPL1F_04180, partial [bacterium]